MTIQIPFHDYDVELCRENIEYYVEWLQECLCNIGNPEFPGLTLRGVVDPAIRYVGLLSQFRPCTNDTGKALRIAAYVWNYAFVLGRYPYRHHQEEVLIPPSKPILLPTAGTTGYLNTGNWIDAFHLACICREPSINDSLCEYPTERLREASKHGVHSSEYAFAHVEMLKAFWRDDPKLSEYFIKAYKTTIEETDENYVDYAINIASYEIQLFGHLHHEPEKFSEVLAEAVERYKKHFFANEELCNATRYFLATGLLAMCSIAFMRDIPIDVESDYIPRCIIEGQFQEHPDDVICEAWAERPEWETPPFVPSTEPESTETYPRIKQVVEIPLESLSPEEQAQFSELAGELTEAERQLADYEQSLNQ
jgi:Immunity protein 49